MAVFLTKASKMLVGSSHAGKRPLLRAALVWLLLSVEGVV